MKYLEFQVMQRKKKKVNNQASYLQPNTQTWSILKWATLANQGAHRGLGRAEETPGARREYLSIQTYDRQPYGGENACAHHAQDTPSTAAGAPTHNAQRFWGNSMQSPEFILLWLYESKGCLVPFSSLFLPSLSLSC